MNENLSLSGAEDVAARLLRSKLKAAMSRLRSLRFTPALVQRVSLWSPVSATTVSVPPSVPKRAPWKLTFEGMKVKPSSGVSVSVSVFELLAADENEAPVAL